MRYQARDVALRHLCSMPTLLCLCVVSLMAISTATLALTIDGVQVSKNEAALMSPVCRLITIERPGIHHGAGARPLQSDLPILLSRPEYYLAVENPNLHHYCWSEVRLLRYFRLKSKSERSRQYDAMLSDIDYVLTNTNEKWPYFYVMLTKQATIMYYHGEHSAGLKKVDEALELKRDNAQAHALKSNLLAALGRRDAAIAAALAGLEMAPNAQSLRRQLKNLGASEVDIEAAVSKGQRALDAARSPDVPSGTQPPLQDGQEMPMKEERSQERLAPK